MTDVSMRGCRLAGFQIHPYYTDFSTPCYDGKHNLIMGGSFVSTGDQATHWARYSFRPHFLQHSGIRLAASETPMPAHLLTEVPLAPNHSAPHRAQGLCVCMRLEGFGFLVLICLACAGGPGWCLRDRGPP